MNACDTVLNASTNDWEDYWSFSQIHGIHTCSRAQGP